MTIIQEFPDDDAFWLVKWIDGYRLPHQGTASASTEVLLQRLSITSQATLNRLSKADVMALLARGSGVKPPLGAPAEFFDPPTRVHVGTTPLLRIGQVFQRQRYVGELPQEQMLIELALVEESCKEVTIGQLLQSPEGWPSKYPYYLLYTSEYSGVQDRYRPSRCLVYMDEATKTEVIIPRSVIFREFYLVDTELANAFTTGTWPECRSKLIHEGRMESGLETRIDSETGDWHIVVMTKVLRERAHILAVYRFDDYGEKCAESIYSKAYQDRGSETGNPWFASARIPFRADNDPLRLEVKGFQLHTRSAGSGEDRKEFKRMFLVTQIVSCSWPKYIPKIRDERFNSGEGSDSGRPVEGDRPYSGARSSRPGGADTRISSGADSNATKGAIDIPSAAMNWSNGQEFLKLEKSSHKEYPKGQPDAGSGGGSGDASTGRGSYSKEALEQARVNSLTRAQVDRFKLILDALKSLLADKAINGYTALHPADPRQFAHRGGYVCWSFLDASMRSVAQWPRSGWRMIKRAKGRQGLESLGVPRCALVLKIDLKSGVGYWIEIETRLAETGMLSCWITSLKDDEQRTIERVIDAIAVAEGSNLRKVLPKILGDAVGANVRCYTHMFKREGNEVVGITTESLKRCIVQADR